jgi:parvulin-like peptidyl-prolyl isomerase
VTADVTVADSDVRAYYERNLDRYRIREARRVRHVLLADEATARGVVRELRSGASLAELAAQHSIDAGTRTLGGDLGEVHRGELAGPLELALFEAEVGAIIGPIQTEHGWHVAAVESWQPAAHVPYDDVRASIEAELLEAARASAFGAWLEERRAALAVMDPGFSHPADPVHGRPSHRH